MNGHRVGDHPRLCRPATSPQWVYVPTALLATLGILTGCSAAPAGSNAQAVQAPPAIRVSATAAVARSVPIQVLANGTAQAMASVTINSQVDGAVASIHFTEGQDVQAGDLLFTLDQRPFDATVRQAQANLTKDTAQRQQAEAALAQARAGEREAQANLKRDMAQLENAQAEVRRYKSLIDDGAISREQYDQVRTAALAMQATVQADEAAVNNAKAAIGAAQASVENAAAAIQADEAVVASARIQLDYTTIRSPMAGRTGNLLVHVGSTVKARDATSPLVVINQMHPIYVSFSVPEHYLADIRKYRAVGSLQVGALIPGHEAKPARGVLTFVNNTVDPSTGTIQLKATFPNADNRLWPGQFLNIVLTLTTVPHAVVVPNQAVQTGQQGPYGNLSGSRFYRYRPIVPGETVDNDTVVKRGVSTGDQIVTDGQIRLVPGAKVEVTAATPAPARSRTTE